MSQPKLQLTLPLRLTLAHFVETIKLTVTEGEKGEKEGSGAVENRLRAMVPDNTSCNYGRQFVSSFLLIKLNSWAAYSAFPKAAFIPQLLDFFNRMPHSPAFKFSRNDGELMAQILLESQAYKWLKEEQVEEVLEGNALVGAAVAQAIRLGEQLMRKCYFVVVLGLISLHGRTNPYIPIVHQEKNHKGQINFAQRIDALIHLNPKIQKVNLDIIQDAYSLRCSPQVHGVSIDCLASLKNALDGLVNRPQTKYVQVGGRRVRNLALRAESQVQLLDQLIMALNEIGHMSFLRAQRILNVYLGKNNIRNSIHYEYLRLLLKKSSYLVGENKLLATPSSADTILLHDYQHDIYFHEATAHNRLTTMLSNLPRIFKVELMGALEVIFSMYAKEKTLFVNEEMEEVYLGLIGLRSEDSLSYGEAVAKWLGI